MRTQFTLAQPNPNDTTHARDNFIQKFIYPPDTSVKEVSDKKMAYIPLVSLGFSPETSLQFGSYNFFTFNLFPDQPKTRRSTIDFDVNYTLNRQFLTQTRFDIITSEEKWFLNGDLNYRIFPENYYGLGNQSLADDEENYDAKRLATDVSAMRNLKPGKGLFIGPRIRTLWMYDVASSVDSGFFDRGEVPQGRGGVYSGLGLRFQWDRRKGYTVSNPRRGHFVSLSAVGFHDQLLSDASFVMLEADFRKYWSLPGKARDVLAIQVLGRASPGEPPFRLMPLMGDSRDLRGYYRGRFRDLYYSSAQIEYRADVFWRFGIAAWAGVGEVFGPSSDVRLNTLKPTAGGGVRFKIDRRNDINARMDFGVGRDGNMGFYLSLGEAF